MVDSNDRHELLRLYTCAIGRWGEQLQIDMAIEEMAELITELARNRRGRGRRAHVEEEIADVRIMLEQLELIYDCAAEVREWRRRKLERLENRLTAEEKAGGLPRYVPGRRDPI